MRRLAYPLAAGAVFSWLLLQAPAPARAQQKGNNETVKIETVDGVTLKGTYWPGNKQKKSPVAILLHRIGGQSSENGWKDLAEDLQKADFAVLSFDFRGHGASTEVNPMVFWDRRFPHNATGMKFKIGAGGKLPDAISLTDFYARYLPHLVDDIAAARSFMDRKNDAGECNSSNIVLIGADDGATLGALWLASEAKRYRFLPVGFQGKPAEKPESKDVSACVWLSITNDLGAGIKKTLNVGTPLRSWIKEAGNTQVSKVPMAFLFGKDDKNGDQTSLKLVQAIRGTKYVRDKVDINDPLKGTLDKAIANSGRLTGNKLLSEPLNTRDLIVTHYLGKFIFDEKKGLNEWEKRENEKANYKWYVGLRGIPASMPGEKNPLSIPLGLMGLAP
jgi:hypothetical protein